MNDSGFLYQKEVKTLDKYEYGLKIQEIENRASEGRYAEAVEIADTIAWRRIKVDNQSLIKAAEIYYQAGRYDTAKELMLIAYDKAPIGKKIMKQLVEMAIGEGEIQDAEDYYNAFVEEAPHDSTRFVLRYHLSRAKNEPIQVRIGILEQLKDHEYTEEWAYELAYLYHEAGQRNECVATCDELILCFAEGEYVEKALELKMIYSPLTPSQEQLYHTMQKAKQGITEIRPGEQFMSGEIVTEVKEIHEVTYNADKYNTKNLQEELAKGMQQIKNATLRKEIDSTMENIRKRLTEAPPEIGERITGQLPTQESYDVQYASDKEIDQSLGEIYQQILEEYDGQMSLNVPDGGNGEGPIAGQVTIDDVMGSWNRTSMAAEMAMREVETRKLETAKARALQEAEDIMTSIVSVVPETNEAAAQQITARVQADPTQENYDAAAEELLKLNAQIQSQIDMMNAAAQARNMTPDPLAQPVMPEPAAPRVNRDFFGLRGDYDSDKVVTHEIPEPTEEFLAAKPVVEPSAIYNEEPAENEGLEDILAKWNSFTASDAEADNRKKSQEEDVFESLPEINIEQEIAEEYEADLKIAETELASTQDLSGLDLGNIATESIENVIEDELISEDDTEAPVYSEQILTPEIKTTTGTRPLPDLSGIIAEAEDSVEDNQVISEEQAAPESRMKIADTKVMPEIPEISLDIFGDDKPGWKETVRVKDKEEGSGVKAASEQLTQALRQSTKPMEKLERSALLAGYHNGHIERLTPELAEKFKYIAKVEGMDTQICRALNCMSDYLEDKLLGGCVYIAGAKGVGKSQLAKNLAVTLKTIRGKIGKTGKSTGNKLNNQDLNVIFSTFEGGCLIVEDAGKINASTAAELKSRLDEYQGKIIFIFEGETKDLKTLFNRNPELEAYFTARINIPAFSNDELVEFAKCYATEAGYVFDNLAVLALYTRINAIQKIDQAATIAQVKEIVDEAIEKVEKPSLGRMFKIVTGRHYDDEAFVIIHEKDFNN